MTRHCDLCDETSFELIACRDRHGKELLTDLCSTCGLISHRFIPSEEELAEFYAHEYRKQYHGESTPSPRRVMRAWKIGQRLVRQLAPCIPAGGEVLEVGAGIGCTVKALEEQGFAARGIEPNHGFRAFAKNQLRAQVSRGYLFDLPAAPRFDCVFLVHVIEHLRSPRTALEHLHATLRADGLLYVECPNVGAPFTVRRRLFHFAHIYNFTRATLTALAGRCGFEPVHWFTAPNASELGVLFRRTDAGSLAIDPSSVELTRQALDRYNVLTYNLRWRYLLDRTRKLASYAEEHLVARRYVRRLLERVQAAKPIAGAHPEVSADSVPPPRFARGSRDLASTCGQRAVLIAK